MTDLAINMHDVQMQYPHFSLKDLNLSLEKGSILGLIGPNGAGKSTTIRILMGLLYPDQGQVEVLGYDMLTQAHKARWRMGYVSEDLRLYSKMTIGWHMQFVRNMFADWDNQYAEELLRRFDLNPEQKVKGLSHGQRVKAATLLVLARRPELLILDEPTTGLDPVARMEVLDEMMAVLMDEHRGIVFSSHNTADVEQLSDQIAFIDRGQMISCRDKESYLDSWRRLRLRLDQTEQLEALNGVVLQEIQGRSAVVVTDEFSDALLSEWQSKAFSIESAETMTLEEIFLAEVKSSRQRRELV